MLDFRFDLDQGRTAVHKLLLKVRIIMMSFLQKKKNKFCLKLKTCYVSRTSNLDFEVFVLVPDNSEMIEALENIRCFSSLGANR